MPINIIQEQRMLKNDSQHPSKALYCAEGSIHLYSSEPVMLTPADLYKVKEDPALRELVKDCNVYIIATRPRILIRAGSVSISNNTLRGDLIVRRPSGIINIPFEMAGFPEWGAIAAESVELAPHGTHIDLALGKVQFQIPVHFIVANARSALEPVDTDLEVLYVGQGIGRLHKRSALDRLLGHTTLQRILAEMSTFHPQSEILLLLYRFEYQRSIISNGGDLTVDPLATDKEDRAHLARMRTASLTRHEKIALAEAALIRHFQPFFNSQIKHSNFSGRRKLQVLDRLLKKDMTGLIVEICSAKHNSRLRTADRSPTELCDIFSVEMLNGSRLKSDEDRQEWQQQLHCMAHTHYAQFALTTPEERDTFMHGVRWHSHDQRSRFLHG
jgi:hypothetical protein